MGVQLTARADVHERKQFGVPVGTFQLMQGKIAGASAIPSHVPH